MKQALEILTNGHYIATAIKDGDELKTRDKDYIVGATVNWVSQASFEPLLISLAVELQSDLNETIDYSGKFCLHVLDKQNEAWIERFAGDSSVESNTLNGEAFEVTDGFLKVKGAAAYLCCKVVDSQTVGDHTLYTAEVVKQEVARDNAPLCTKETSARYTA